jgi:endonuclease/exonuclease/phosphatase family metal-dependent hydrolase
MVSKMIKLLSCNMDSNLSRLEDGFARDSFPLWRIEKRIPHILSAVKTLKPDCIHFQEGRKCQGILDSITPFVEGLSDDYHVLVQPYNETEKAFSYISCYLKSRFQIKDRGMYYFTSTPTQSRTAEQLSEYEKSDIDRKELVAKWKKNNGYEEFERGLFWVLLHDDNSGQDFYALNVHKGLHNLHRLLASERINEFVADKENVIMCGDFNSFSDWDGPKQTGMINMEKADKVLQYVPDYRVNMEETVPLELDVTFHAYPYDYAYFEKEEEIKNDLKEMNKMNSDGDITGVKHKVIATFFKCCSMDDQYPLTGHLDHVFYKGLKLVRETAVVPFWCDKAVPLNALSLRTLITQHLYQEKPTLATDHFPLMTTFSF